MDRKKGGTEQVEGVDRKPDASCDDLVRQTLAVSVALHRPVHVRSSMEVGKLGASRTSEPLRVRNFFSTRVDLSLSPCAT